jgi:hypothetical protein
LIFINKNGEAVDVYYNGVDLDHLERIMSFAEEARTMASCFGVGKQINH